MKWFDILRLVLVLMQAVEAGFGPKTGATKKDVVVGAVKTGVDALSFLSEGGQKNTWDKIAEPVSNIVDNFATVLFPK